jgi:hypothetical protein
MNALATVSIEDLLAEVARRESAPTAIHTPAEYAAALVAELTANGTLPQGYGYYADKPGRRFTRIVMTMRGSSQRSVHCFIENATGAVFKAATWTSPAHKATARFESMDAALAEATWTGAYLYAR